MVRVSFFMLNLRVCLYKYPTKCGRWQCVRLVGFGGGRAERRKGGKAVPGPAPFQSGRYGGTPRHAYPLKASGGRSLSDTALPPFRPYRP